MSDLEHAQDLAGAPERDVTALRGMGDAAVFADEIFGFHVQQAAEKPFKAWLALQGETYPLSHDPAARKHMLNAGGTDVARFDGLVDCTPYAVRLRYAAAGPGVGPLRRHEAVEQVEALLATIQRQLAQTEAD